MSIRITNTAMRYARVVRPDVGDDRDILVEEWASGTMLDGNLVAAITASERRATSSSEYRLIFAGTAIAVASLPPASTDVVMVTVMLLSEQQQRRLNKMLALASGGVA